jgi:hypothetical protein
MLKELNYDISLIDLSGVLKAHEMRKAGKKNNYKYDKKDEIGKIKKYLAKNQQEIKDKEQSQKNT